MDDADRDPFLTCVYEHYMPWFAAPLFSEEEDEEDDDDGGREQKKEDDEAFVIKKPGRIRKPPVAGTTTTTATTSSSSSSSLLNWSSRAQICETLAYCVRAHAYQIKYFLLRSNVVLRIAHLASSAASSRAFRLGAVRFVRSCIGVKDDFYAKYLVKNGTLGNVIALVGTVKADSLVACAVAELLDFVRSENVKTLVEHLVRHHADKIASSETHAKLLLGLEQRLAQNEDAGMERTATIIVTHGADDDVPGSGSSQDGEGQEKPYPSKKRGRFNNGGGLTAQQLARRERILLEDRDEAYFDDSDDEDDDDNNNVCQNNKKKVSSVDWDANPLKRNSFDAGFTREIPKAETLRPKKTTKSQNDDDDLLLASAAGLLDDDDDLREKKGETPEEEEEEDSDSRSSSSKRSRTTAETKDDDAADDGFVPRSRASSISSSSEKTDAAPPRSPAFFNSKRGLSAHRRPKNRRVEIKWNSKPIDNDDLQQKRPRLDEPIASS